MSRPITLTQRTRALTLRAEGLPASWVAEDLGLAVGTVQSRFPSPAGEPAQWRTVFQAIRRHPDLFALHQEFAPARRGALK